jgi:Tfp pilus assembly protein PilN
MTATTKVVAWVGAILGVFAIVVLSVTIAIGIYTTNRASEQQRQQEKAMTTLKQGLTQDLKDLSRMEIKPMTGDEFRRLNSSPTPAGK